MALLLVSLMMITATGSAIGGNATEALFFARFGTDQLPAMYIILGLFTFVAAMAITVVMGRIAKQRLYVTLPLLLGLLLIGERLVIPYNFRWFFALIWLMMNVINSLLGLLTWGLAGLACDTRQAKRLFPLFSAGGILGTVLGGFITQPLAARLHSENLLLFWAGTMLISFVLGRALTAHTSAGKAVSHTPHPKLTEEIQSGYRFVRRSQIMQWVSYSAILFSICYFSLALPFARGATDQFSDADQLAGFLGLFQGLNTIAALLASLLLANRLFARFGILPVLLIFPIIYLAGFGVLAVYAPFAVLVAARFAQMAYMNGIAGTAWHTMFNIVSPDYRDQVRAFVEGVPEQAGTFIAGLVLFAGEQALEPQQLYLVGLGAAAILVYIIWRAGRAYGQALVDALRAGQPQIFFHEEQPFSAPGIDATAVSVAIRGLGDPDPRVRRVSAEIVGQIPVSGATEALNHALADTDAMVRAAALKGIVRAKAKSALSEIANGLSDPDPDVRCTALLSFGRLDMPPDGMPAYVEPLLADGDPCVRSQAALTLLRAGEHAGARETLHAMAVDSDPLMRVQALEALRECGDALGFILAVSALDDPQPMVRRAASGALVSINPGQAMRHLVRHLNDNDPSVRCELAEALGKVGEPALGSLINALGNPLFEEGVLMALEHLPVRKAEQALRDYAKRTTATALRYHYLASKLMRQAEHIQPGNGRLELLAESLQNKGKHSAVNVLRAVGLVTARETVAVALENLGSRDASQRANALETLEVLGEHELVRPLLSLWEAGETNPRSLPEDWLINLLDDPDGWLRACAVMVAAQVHDHRLHEKIARMGSTDPDEFVRNAAESVILGGTKMEAMTVLSQMERILFLRRVPLFSDLAPADLKQVAVVTNEVVFPDGHALAYQGEPGTEMYIVISGEVRVLVETENQKEPTEVARRYAGDYVGEMAVISQEPRIATLVADGTVRVLCLKQKQFEGMLRERPDIGLAMMRTLCQRLKEATVSAAVR